MHRRTATKVKDGRVQKKNNWAPDPGDYWAVAPDEIVFDRVRPAPGRRHVVNKAQVLRVLHLLPDWDVVAVGLRAILLDDEPGCFGWYDDGVVALCDWDHDLWIEHEDWFLEEHAHIFELLDIDVVGTEVRYTEEQARAFMLLHILPHELGHHHDRMSTRSKWRSPRGESYAEDYANRALEVLWPLYSSE